MDAELREALKTIREDLGGALKEIKEDVKSLRAGQTQCQINCAGQLATLAASARNALEAAEHAQTLAEAKVVEAKAVADEAADGVFKRVAALESRRTSVVALWVGVLIAILTSAGSIIASWIGGKK